MSPSTSDRRVLAALALLAALAIGCDEARCVRHSDCAPPLSCLATRCAIPPTDADTGVADTAVVDTAVIDTAVVLDATTATDATVTDTSVADGVADVLADGGSADAAEDASMDVSAD